ncbi:RNase adapter RapZ [Porphyrobacter sp. GA68]|uniref:RNase adapter RapZ n=1 Tax=Porphyrobacter sp. GA68 TaxID=2883480 RepID=UPI001D1867A1|nr:RNase adapter RapZ [Porphyrobacter sp. GA68]
MNNPVSSHGDAATSADEGAGRQLLLVTGLSGAGKTTVLHALEDAGWETVDNLPVPLLGELAGFGSGSNIPLAVGIDARTRGFNPADLLSSPAGERNPPATLFLTCEDGELIRRFNVTRRRHPLAQDRSLAEGIAAERELLAPLANEADEVIDTTGLTQVDLQQLVRERYHGSGAAPMIVTITSFGFARGMPPVADLLFDVRFLANPHWVDGLREQTGQDAMVGDYVASDPAFAPAFSHIAGLVETLLPFYRAQGRSYLNVALGCTGGKHRSVFTAERLANHLRKRGFSPTVRHRNLALPEPARPAVASEEHAVASQV